MPVNKKQQLPKGTTWDAWYPGVRDNPAVYGPIAVPNAIRVMPCNCRQDVGELEIYRAKGDAHFRCNSAGCGAVLQ